MFLTSLNNSHTFKSTESKANRNSAGFTLLEVLISMAVLVLISFAIFQATTETYKLRENLTLEGNFYNPISLSMSIIQRDIALIYSPMAYLAPNPKSSTTPNDPRSIAPSLSGNSTDDLNRSYLFWSATTNSEGIRPSHFVGSENKVSFISLAHIRIYKDSPESEFSKITYDLKKDDNNPDPNNRGLSVLVKTESPNVWASEDVKDTYSRSYELLHGVKKLSYLYYQRDGETWKKFKSWDSDQEDTLNLVPDIIEISLEVKGPNNLNFEGKYKFRPEIPIHELNHSM